jgi:hypothetical protein
MRWSPPDVSKSERNAELEMSASQIDASGYRFIATIV